MIMLVQGAIKMRQGGTMAASLPCYLRSPNLLMMD